MKAWIGPTPGASAEILEKALRKLSTGEMPPAGMPRPTPAAVAAFTAWLGESLDRYAAAHPNPGRPAIHRLNRAEYSNAIRDLLALDTKPGATASGGRLGLWLRQHRRCAFGFAVAARAVYSVARRVSRMAVGDLDLKPAEEEFPNPVRAARDRVSDDLPFDSAGGMSIGYYFPVDAEYVIRVKTGGGDNAPAHEVRMPIQAGLRTVGATFLKESSKPENAGGRRGGGPGAPLRAPRRGGRTLLHRRSWISRLDGARLKLFPVPAGPGGRRAAGGPHCRSPDLTTSPAAATPPAAPGSSSAGLPPAQDEAPCARTILTTLARRAFRRPVTDADIKPLLAFYERGRAEGDFDHGIEKALNSPAGIARLHFPGGTRSQGRGARLGVPRQRLRTGFAAVLLPVEQRP